MGHHLPPSQAAHTHLFFIGRNSRGHWVVQDQTCKCGGLFVDRAEAIRYALFENGRQPNAVVMVPGTLELDLSGAAATSPVSAVKPLADDTRSNDDRNAHRWI